MIRTRISFRCSRSGAERKYSIDVAENFMSDTIISVLLQFVKDEFDTFLECGILADGFLRLCCGEFWCDVAADGWLPEKVRRSISG